jgi:ubiquinone/menaquinone biosynthesis C-methylase UbiE
MTEQSGADHAREGPANERLPGANVDARVVAGFGDEWRRFDQRRLDGEEARQLFEEYFHVFPWGRLGPDAVGFDLGCGSGRWARFVAPRVGTLHCVDASAEALAVARCNLNEVRNCEFHLASVDFLPLADESADFGYALGVLHHVPDTRAGVRSCVRKLKPGAPFLLYLYYAFDNRPWWFRLIWRLSDPFRRVISRLSRGPRYLSSQMIAAVVYWPLARTARLMEAIGLPLRAFPLSYYRRRSFYVMRTDALDRFGTALEQRFTRHEIEAMMRDAGLEEIRFSDQPPFWCAVGVKRNELSTA